MTTWLDIKIATLQKIFAIPGDTLIENTSTGPYLKSMPQVANEALQLLSTAGKFITKSVNITQNPITNILPNALLMMNIYQHGKTDVTYSAYGATSYYFEVDSTATVLIKVDGTTVATIENTVKGDFTAYKGFITNPDSKLVEIVFSGLYSYNYQNIALYDQPFETVGDIWPYVPEKRYDMKTLATDFYKLVNSDLVYQGGFNELRYEKTSDYHWEGDSVLVLNALKRGAWKVHYHAYPQQITKDTPDSTVMSLDPEVVALLPLYMASQLYKEDEISIAVGWRNEFEVARGLLLPNAAMGSITFVSESGW